MLSDHRIFTVVLLAGIGLLYAGFPLRIHTWESYAYARALDGQCDLREIFAPYIDDYRSLPDIGRFHPNHPLLHFISLLIVKGAGRLDLSADPLGVVTTLNLLFALSALYVCWRTVMTIDNSYTTALALTLSLAFSNVFWYQALSGEVYMASAFWLILSFHLLTGNKERNLWAAGLTLGLAASFHLLAAAFVLPFVHYALKTGVSRTRLLRGLSLFVLTLALTYGLALVFVLGTHSVQDYTKTMLIYSKVFGPGSWVYNATPRFRALATAQGIGIYSLAKALISEHSPWFTPACFALATALLFALVGFVRGSTSYDTDSVLLLWFFIFFFMFTTVVAVPEVNDYWCLNLFPLLYFIIRALNRLLPPKSIYLLPVILLLSNFTFDILPKSGRELDRHFIARAAKGKLAGFRDLVFISPGLDSSIAAGQMYNLHRCFKNCRIHELPPGDESRLKRLLSLKRPFALICYKTDFSRLANIQSELKRYAYVPSGLFSMQVEEPVGIYKTSTWSMSLNLGTKQNTLHWTVLAYRWDWDGID